MPTTFVLTRSKSATPRMTVETFQMRNIVHKTSVLKTLHVTMSALVEKLELSVTVMKDLDQVKTTSTNVKTLMSARSADLAHRDVSTPLGHTNVPAILAMFSRPIYKAARQTAPFPPG